MSFPSLVPSADLQTPDLEVPDPEVLASPVAGTRYQLRLRTWLICTFLMLAIHALVVLSGAVGSVQVSLREAAQILVGHLVPTMP